ncbi:hypothetical protein D3C73_1026890 [compost metagenome]
MTAGFLEQAVHVERNARQVAEILKQGEYREENHHRRQHYADYPGGSPVQPQHKHTVQPSWCMERFEPGGQIALDPAEERSQPARRVVGTGNRNPEDETKSGEHDREAPELRGNDPVQLVGAAELFLITVGDGIAADSCRHPVYTGDNFVADRTAAGQLTGCRQQGIEGVRPFSGMQ